MSLLDQVDSDFNQALKSKESEKLSILRLLKSAIKNAEIEKKQPLTDEDVIKIIQKEVKQRKDSIESFQSAGRTELAEKEQSEIELLKKYLPAEISDEELEKIVKDSIDTVGAKSMSDFGNVMSQVMPKISGKADGSRVSEKVKEILG